MSETFHEFCVAQVKRLSATIFQTGVDPQAALSEIREQIETKLSRGERDFVRQLIDESLAAARHCPSVADLTTLANGIRGRAQEAREAAERAKWPQTYGAPKPFNWLEVDLKAARRRREEREVMERWVAERVRSETNGLRRKELDRLPIQFFVPLLREAGFPKTDYQREVLKAWEKTL